MNSIHSKAFLDAWRALYQESNPGPTVDHRRCDGVYSVRQTYRVGARDYAFHIDVPVLTRPGTGPGHGRCW